MPEAREVEKEMQEKQEESARAQRKQGELEAAHLTHKRELTWRNTSMADLVQEFSLSGRKQISFQRDFWCIKDLNYVIVYVKRAPAAW